MQAASGNYAGAAMTAGKTAMKVMKKGKKKLTNLNFFSKLKKGFKKVAKVVKKVAKVAVKVAKSKTF